MSLVDKDFPTTERATEPFSSAGGQGVSTRPSLDATAVTCYLCGTAFCMGGLQRMYMRVPAVMIQQVQLIQTDTAEVPGSGEQPPLSLVGKPTYYRTRDM